jgi:hypothetical protein
VRAVDRRGRGQSAGVGLSLRDARALLHVGVQRDRDRRQDTDDGDDDQELDQRETTLTAQHGPFAVPELRHFILLSGFETLLLFGDAVVQTACRTTMRQKRLGNSLFMTEARLAPASAPTILGGRATKNVSWRDPTSRRPAHGF